MQDNLVFRLPDAYAKPIRGRTEETATNNWRLLHIVEARADEFMSEIDDVDALNDINNLYGAALDALAAMYSITREDGESDEDFLERLFLQIRNYFSDGTLEYIRTNLETEAGAESGAFTIEDNYPAKVRIILTGSISVTPSKLRELAENLLPIGVGVEMVKIPGTFLYCSTEDDFSDPDVAAFYDGTGYGDLNGTVGGTLGWCY